MASLIVIASLVGIVMLAASALSNSSPTGTGTSASPASQPPRSYDTAEAAVEAFLNAVAQGDSVTAIALLTRAPGDRSLLTDEMLAASAAVAPITDVTVTPDPAAPEHMAEVPVSYKVGEQLVQTKVQARQSTGGSWVVYGTSTMRAPYGSDGLAITVNGIGVANPDQMEVFPGSYEIATTTRYYTFKGTTQTITTTDFSSDGFRETEITLNDEGLKVFREAIVKDVDACLASKKIDPGCGLGLESNPDRELQPIEDTFKRELSAEAKTALKNLKPELDFENPFSVSAGRIGSLKVTAKCEDTAAAKKVTPCEQNGARLGRPVVDFSTDPVTVRW
ncbi:MAG: hypothetical protein ACK5LN_09705 [Propioniciclava sp.]